MAMAHTLECRPVRLGAPHWLALQTLALWPHGVYLAQRAFDGSDDPLGLVALVAAAALVASQRHRLRLLPHLGWLVAALTLALVGQRRVVGRCPVAGQRAARRAVAGQRAAGVVAARARRGTAAGAGGARAAVARDAAVLPRLAAARADRAAQRLGLAAVRLGRRAQRRVDGGQRAVGDRRRAVFRRADGVVRVLHRLPVRCRRQRALTASSCVERRWWASSCWPATCVRNSVLVALESRPQGLTPFWHEAIGLAALAAVCAAVWALIQRAEVRHA